MINQTCRFVTLAVTTLDTPPAATGSLPAMSHLAAIGLLIAERNLDDQWRFALRRHAIGAGEGEDLLLAWATRTMPATGITLGWQLADAVVAPLLEASNEADPDIARAFLDNLTTLVTTPSIDLAIAHGGAAAPPLAGVAAAQSIDLVPMTTAEIESAWSFGDTDRLRADVAAHAIAACRLWLSKANGAGTDARAAFEAWALGA